MPECAYIEPAYISKSTENAFITVGFDNWKDATRSFEQHHKSACHREALMKWEHHTKGSGVSIQLQHQLASDQEKGRHCLMKLPLLNTLHVKH